MDINALLARNRNYQPVFKAGLLCNHLSMALIALHRMNADPATLARFVGHYSPRLEPLDTGQERPDSIKIASGNWQELIGFNKNINDLYMFFKVKLENKSCQELLPQWLEPLLGGISTQAFHCLIRLAYALEIADNQEVAMSLAYWAAHHHSLLPAGAVPASSRDMSVSLAQLRQYFGTTRIQASNITAAMQSAAQLPEFPAHAASATPRLEDLTKISLNLYLTDFNFTALHAVTGCHALRIIIPYLKNPQDALKYFAEALAAAYVTMGCPELRPQQLAPSDLSTEDIMQKIRHSEDEHDIKLAYTLLQEHQHYQEPRYLDGAARLLDPARL